MVILETQVFIQEMGVVKYSIDAIENPEDWTIIYLN